MHSAFIDLFAEGISIKYLLIALFGKLGLLSLTSSKNILVKVGYISILVLHNSIYPTKLGLLVNPTTKIYATQHYITKKILRMLIQFPFRPS